MNAFILTCKGQKLLTEQCLSTMAATLGVLTQPAMLVVVDAAEGQDALTYEELRAWTDKRLDVIYTRWVCCTLTRGWNFAINSIKHLVLPDQNLAKVYVHLTQNDAIFLKEGWLQKIEEALGKPNVGSTGTSQGVTDGYPFVTGVIQSFILSDGLIVAVGDKIIDERFNHAYPDVDLSIRFSRAGYKNARVEGIEYGNDPYIQHIISATMYSEHGVDKVMAMREEEKQIFLSKWGKA